MLYVIVSHPHHIFNCYIAAFHTARILYALPNHFFLGDHMQFLDKLSYSLLILATIIMLLAPFYPMPHVVEKLLMLKDGILRRPIDIFDLFFHLVPLALLIAKVVRDFIANGA